MRKRIAALCILVIIAGLVFWFFYPLRSLIVMSVYSSQHSESSVMRQSGFEIEMPSGAGWYPFVMTYNADGFAAWSGTDAQMSIMYNFGAFDLLKRTSTIYDTDSERYSSFYGAYVLKEDDGAFGFNANGILDNDEVTEAVRYDYTQLVMEAFGCASPVFEVNDFKTKKETDYAGSAGWTRIDARISASGVVHNYSGYKTPYLQYGRPMESVEKDFAQTALFGRIYAKYFSEYGCTVMIYVIAPDENAVEECDDDILSKTVIKVSD